MGSSLPSVKFPGGSELVDFKVAGIALFVGKDFIAVGAFRTGGTGSTVFDSIVGFVLLWCSGRL